jgi:S-adenosylmethionine:tRNA ribosyltransferase-isomerase
MRTQDFDYPLPPELIAQEPLKDRDSCRLLELDRTTGAVSHHVFSDLATLLRPGDLLVLNDTKVLPARVFGRRPSGGRVELLFTEPLDNKTWKALAKPGKRLMPGGGVVVGPAGLNEELEIVAAGEAGERTVRLSAASSFGSLAELIERYGVMPIPPYIRRPAKPEDNENYQTVYARASGAVAAPTAGLHVTDRLLGKLRERGVACAFLTLHVGLGTFQPVKVDDPAAHPMHEEEYVLPPETALAVIGTKQAGGRVIAVGTTVVRVLEHCGATDAGLTASSGRTSLKILPPYPFRIVDGIITNFHLPQSTLFMLVAAFAGRERVLAAYAEAVAARYRFFSYGDAMFIH